MKMPPLRLLCLLHLSCAHHLYECVSELNKNQNRRLQKDKEKEIVEKNRKNYELAR